MKSFSMRLGLILALSIATLVFLLTITLTYMTSQRSAASLEAEIGERLSMTSHQLVDKLDFICGRAIKKSNCSKGSTP
ncbi:hypothetical protein [Exiguobacterium mexicanum]|uniref:hypothetical protein n=1 Tax=Exiguobacterium mexicanum TaxID=340146 RepID=UPI0037C0F063